MKMRLILSFFLLLLVQWPANATSLFNVSFTANDGVGSGNGLFTYDSATGKITYDILINGWSLQAAADVEAGNSPCGGSSPCDTDGDLLVNSVIKINTFYHLCPPCNGPINLIDIILLREPTPSTGWINANYPAITNFQINVSQGRVSGSYPIVCEGVICRPLQQTCLNIENNNSSDSSMSGCLQAAIPDPGSLPLLGIGLVGISLLLRRSV